MTKDSSPARLELLAALGVLLSYTSDPKTSMADLAAKHGFPDARAMYDALAELAATIGLPAGTFVTAKNPPGANKQRRVVPLTSSAAQAAIRELQNSWETFGVSVAAHAKGLGKRPWSILSFSAPVELFLAEAARDISATATVERRPRFNILPEDAYSGTVLADDRISFRDFAILSHHTTRPHLGAHAAVLYTWDLRVVVSPEHKWRGRAQVTVKELATATFGNRELQLFVSLESHASGRCFAEAQRVHGFRPGSVTYTANSSARYQLANNGVGIAVLPADSPALVQATVDGATPYPRLINSEPLRGCYTVTWSGAYDDLAATGVGNRSDIQAFLEAIWSSARQKLAPVPGVELHDFPSDI